MTEQSTSRETTRVRTTPGIEVDIQRNNAPWTGYAVTDPAEAASVLAEVTDTEPGQLACEPSVTPGMWIVELPTWQVEDAREVGELHLAGIDSYISAEIAF